MSIVVNLSKKQNKLLNDYIKSVKGILYEATEDCDIGKFNEYINLMNNIVSYSDAFKKSIKTDKEVDEWAYMVPNLTLYSAMGFFVGIKNDTNSSYIDSLSEELFEKTLSIVGDTSDMLFEEREKREKYSKKKKNEYND